MAIDSILRELRAHADPERAAHSATFFKTGPGEYGAGDTFIGITVPEIRAVAKKYWQLPYGDIDLLIRDPVHEVRLCAALILVARFEKATAAGEESERKKVFEFYLEHATHVNNWDLVDSSASRIVGEYLQEKPRRVLYSLAKSETMWDRRIAIIATLAFISKHQFSDTIAISELLLEDPEDLMHKATGWMLREVGKRDKRVLEQFLRKHAATMPRTALRYSIEHFSPTERKVWLAVGKGKAVVKPRTVEAPRMHGAIFDRVKRTEKTTRR